MDAVDLLNVLLLGLIVVLMILIMCYIIVRIKNKQQKDEQEDSNETYKQESSFQTTYLPKDSVYKFMEFDEVKDNMIIRKNRAQYVMVVKCRGVNYDLMSEEEKTSIEAGFVQFLNTLRFPIQLYIQSSSLNLRDINENYKSRILDMQKEINRLDVSIKEADKIGNQDKVNKLKFEKRRKENVLEYGSDISEYIARLGMNKNILQQKTYIIISYFSAELGKIDNFSKEELDSMCFSEIYTRTQTAIRTLGSCGVVGKILSSEELSELLYVAYNRDESEIMQLSKALDAEYDALYSTSKDILQKRQEVLEDAIDRDAIDLATDSITSADKKIKQMIENRKQIVQDKALEIVEEYKNDMSPELYEQTKKEIVSEKQTTHKRGRKHANK